MFDIDHKTIVGILFLSISCLNSVHWDPSAQHHLKPFNKMVDTETQHDDGNEDNDERYLENDLVEDNVSTPDDIMPNLPP